jgi:hypothetical protein
MATSEDQYPATLEIEYQEKHDRLSTFFRLFWSIPVMVLLAVLSGGEGWTFANDASKDASASMGGVVGGIAVATGLMIIIRQRYPRWWFDFALELNRFATRIGAYLFLLTDKYPSTVDAQSVRLDVVYPDVQKNLNRWLPLVKWLFALPHYVVLLFLIIGVFGATVVAWFSILFTGRYPRGLFDFVVGVGRWNLRVDAYTSLLTTDQYPPFSLK